MHPIQLPTANAVKDRLIQPIVAPHAQAIVIDPECKDQQQADRNEDREKDRKRNVKHRRQLPRNPINPLLPNYFFSGADSSAAASEDSSVLASTGADSAEAVSSAATATSSVDSSAFLPERRERLRVFFALV